MGGPSGLPPLPRTVILDYYDSYTNNLLILFARSYPDKEIEDKVAVIKHDRYSWEEFRRVVLPGVDCIILSPGPGTPDNREDIGFAPELIKLHPVPILGVCLGHQAIGVAFGASVANTPRIQHGHVISVSPTSPRDGLFTGESFEDDLSFDAVVYNSLVIDPAILPECLRVTAWSQVGDTERTIMGITHEQYPIWGVQYHPESISSTRGRALITNFFSAVHSHHSFAASYPPLSASLLQSCSWRPSAPLKTLPNRYLSHQSSLPTPPMTPSSSSSVRASPDPEDHSLHRTNLRFIQRSLGHLTMPASEVFERVIRRRDKGKGKAVGQIWLDGETPSRPTHTSLAAPIFALTYALATREIELHHGSGKRRLLELERETTFWEWLDMAQKDLSVPPDGGGGFRGGWIGWMGYEMKEESLAGYQKRRESDSGRPNIDACWSWSNWAVTRSADGEWVLRAILKDDWGDTDKSHDPSTDNSGLKTGLSDLGLDVGLSQGDFVTLFMDIKNSLYPVEVPRVPSPFGRVDFQPVTSSSAYSHHIEQCRESIRQGDSYELTLTTHFVSDLPSPCDPYQLYLCLRAYNPACYSTFISFPTVPTSCGSGMHVLSSSPERFLKVENVDRRRRVEMMPIKGTRKRLRPGQCACDQETGCKGVAPSSELCERERLRIDAIHGEELRNDVKERAENLMIVDLIRSDLLSCCIPSTVNVPKLIALESYGVHHLVTTVQGILRPETSTVTTVKRCFPPGSMTGAPKLRSVQLLEEYEEARRRGIYSGALGYISADGAADLSVVIRTIVIEGDRMMLGAGGAITWMSDPAKEWDEVLTKVDSVVGSLARV